MTDQTRFTYLLKAYLEHTCSQEQLQEFATLIGSLDDKALSDLLAANWSNHLVANKLDENEAAAILDDILKTKPNAALSANQLPMQNDPHSNYMKRAVKDAKENNINQGDQNRALHTDPKLGQVKDIAPNSETGNDDTVNKYLPINANAKKIRRLYAIAAVIIGLLILMGAFWQLLPFRQDKAKQLLTQANIVRPAKPDIAPGTSGAILTLASGQQVILDSVSAAKGGQQLLAGTLGAIVKLKPGGIEYTGQVASTNAPVKYNTLATPASRTFHVKLPDGTEVWLNAASSIRYPVAFNKNQREVTITGEAYFEVAKLQRADGKGRVPFIVDIQTDHPTKSPSRVEVLGTHFNINAYADQGEIKTTLLEGHVNVYAAASNKATAIIPGDQAVMGTSSNSSVSVHTTDIQKAVAWKNGYFDFNQAGLKEVMQQIGRWYNVEVVYAGNVPDRKFWGKIQRSLYLTQVLSVLEQVDIHFKIEKNKLIVMP